MRSTGQASIFDFRLSNLSPLFPMRVLHTFTLALALLSIAPSRAQDISDLYQITGGRFQSHVEYKAVKIPKGSELLLADLKGPAKITYFYISDVADLALKVYWDDETNPSIQIPLNAFFGYDKDYVSAFFQVNHRCYMCYLPMPFAKRARFVLVNDTGKDYSASMAWGIDYDRDQKYAGEKSRLHASGSEATPSRTAPSLSTASSPPPSAAAKTSSTPDTPSSM
jgi:hypothetical protein